MVNVDPMIMEKPGGNVSATMAGMVLTVEFNLKLAAMITKITIKVGIVKIIHYSFINLIIFFNEFLIILHFFSNINEKKNKKISRKS